MKPHHALWALPAAAFCVALATTAHAEKLPVYKLHAAKVDKEHAKNVFAKAFGTKGTDKDDDKSFRHEAGQKQLEIHKASGHMFLADREKLWNPNAKGGNVPDNAKAKDVADKFLKENQLLPSGDNRAGAEFSHYSETAVVDEQGNKRVLDRQVNYKVSVKVRTRGKEESIPVTGGGAKFRVAVGPDEKIVSYHGGWRHTAAV